MKFEVKLPETMSKTILESYSTEEDPICIQAIVCTLADSLMRTCFYYDHSKKESVPPELGCFFSSSQVKDYCECILLVESVHMTFPGCREVWEGECLAFGVLLMEGSLCAKPRFINQES